MYHISSWCIPTEMELCLAEPQGLHMGPLLKLGQVPLDGILSVKGVSYTP